MKLDAKEAQRAVYEDHEDFQVIKDEIYDTGRWSDYHNCILKHLPTNKFFEVNYSQGSTEMQDEYAFEYENEVTFSEVEPYEKTITAYRKVKTQ
jgi:hypothetical protein